MSTTVQKLLDNQGDNHLMPFLWVHGESAKTYREMIKAIYDANIRAFCVEARPHKEFCKAGWWRDMDILLDEAEKRGMKVWILDDKHFPTGYAAGGVDKAPLSLHRQSVCRQNININGGKRISLNLKKYIRPKNNFDTISKVMMLYSNSGKLPKKYKDDMLLSCTAYETSITNETSMTNGNTKINKNKQIVDLKPFIINDNLKWDAPDGNWSIEICSLSRNTGMHRNYINMMNKESCRILIDEVYEPHYAHYKEKFGKVIAGFFSDEPELGNGNYCKHYNYLGTAQDLPYSSELEELLSKRMGDNWKNMLPLLWKNDYDAKETARVRYIYMDCVTRLVEEDFSKQIGEWCRERGVEYIGHVIEDNNQHARTSTSLGHYFRGLKWQSMAGIDNIGGQVCPGGEDKQEKFIFGYINDGEFYHYALGKLGSSLGALNPNMQGRTMCEIFGNYGWGSGVRTQKYMLDHFLVRGVNHFVPHAFNSKTYPDKDCPPHFYAYGNNPQYRHFGELMKYADRICGLISGGRAVTPVAILYHGEAEWMGKCMLMQKPARILADNQIDFNFVPSDVFSEREFYKTKINRYLTINGCEHTLLIIPYAQFITKEVAAGIIKLQECGGEVIFIDDIPDGLCTGEPIPSQIKTCEVVKLDDLRSYINKINLCDISLSPVSDRIRYMHYKGSEEAFYLFNESIKEYTGKVVLPTNQPIFEYDAWNNKKIKVYGKLVCNRTEIDLELAPSQSKVFIIGDNKDISESLKITGRKQSLTHFKQSICRSIDYPNFIKEREIQSLESYHMTDDRFSGFIRYKTKVKIDVIEQVVLEITDAYEGVEVFVNGKSAGIQVIPIFRYDISKLCRIGENELVIEVATTLERERNGAKNAAPSGIIGEVNLYF